MHTCSKEVAIVVLLLFALSSCHKKSTEFFTSVYSEFIYSRSETGYGDSYSLKLTQSDTVYFKRHKYNPGSEIKYCLINATDKKYIENELSKVKWATLDSTYIKQGLEDGTNRMFYMKQGRAIKSVFMYGEEGQAELLAIANWLDTFRKEQDFKVINKKIDFGDLHRIVIVWPAIPRRGK
jgi:hypothetical protein